MFILIQKYFECYSSFECMMQDVLTDSREEIVERLELFFPEHSGKILDEYEGGIDEWWGPSGSVMQEELGLITELKVMSDGCLLSVYVTDQRDYE